MAQAMWGCRLGQPSRLNSALEVTLKGLPIQKVAASDTAPWIARQLCLRKDPEPWPALVGSRVLSGECVPVP